MDEQNGSEIRKICAEFVNAFDGNLTWKWETRFETALAEFSIDSSDNIHAILERFFNDKWDSSSINDAPDVVQEIVKKFGALRSGQLLFTADTKQDDFLFGVWWPWGNGNMISIRVAPSFIVLPEENYTELIKEFRNWFNI